MTSRPLRIELEINYPVFLIGVLFLHLAFIFFSQLPHDFLQAKVNQEQRTPLKIHSIKQIGSKDHKSLNNVFLNKSETVSKQIHRTGIRSLSDLSVRDFSMNSPRSAPVQKLQRPGTRPEVFPERKKAIQAISLKGSEMKQFLGGANAAALSGDTRNPGMNNSDVMVNLEVPEGVNPDELNEYEMMFYSFQRRTAINYINSFYKNLDEFQKRNPHKNFPMTDTKQIMTGRLTYDEKGNIKQIKMIRWSNLNDLQDFFLEVLKDMDTLHNPPTALWDKSGEFSIFFSLVVNG